MPYATYYLIDKMDNKTLITRLGTTLGRDTSEVSALIEGLCKVFKECGSDLDSVAVPGFGTFKAEKSDEHIDIDDSTGKRTLFPPKISIEFQPSIVLRKKLQK